MPSAGCSLNTCAPQTKPISSNEQHGKYNDKQFNGALQPSNTPLHAQSSTFLSQESHSHTSSRLSEVLDMIHYERLMLA